MANCITCRHNDKKAKYCPVKKAHTDLGYVLNCIAWAPTDEDEMKRLRTENAKLRKLVKDMLDVMLDYRCDIRMPNSLDYSNEPAVFKERARELGVEIGA